MSAGTQAGSSVRDHTWEASSGKNDRNGHHHASHFSSKSSPKTRTLILKRSTKAGNTHARRFLVEGAWAYRYPAKVSRHLQLRLEKQPKVIQDISWKAQVRLCKRYRRLVARGKHANVVTVAIARELTGFLWAIAKEVPRIA
jgi:hypothetical protein